MRLSPHPGQLLEHREVLSSGCSVWSPSGTLPEPLAPGPYTVPWGGTCGPQQPQGRQVWPCSPQDAGVFPWGCASRGFQAGLGWAGGTQATSSRQATRTPSRSEAGLELLTAYYHQLCFLEARFATPARNLGPLFHW